MSPLDHEECAYSKYRSRQTTETVAISDGSNRSRVGVPLWSHTGGDAPERRSGGIFGPVGAMSLYEKYHASREDERLGLFESVRAECGVTRGL